MSDQDATTLEPLTSALAGHPLTADLDADAIAAVAELARRDDAKIIPIPDKDGVAGRLYVKVTRDSDGEQHVGIIDIDDQGSAVSTLERVVGDYGFDTIEALTAYAKPFVTDHTTAWVDADRCRIDVVFDDHASSVDATNGDGQRYGRREHTASLPLKPSKEWEAWAALERGLIGQSEFAEFLELQVPHVLEPTAGDLLAAVITFEAVSESTFESKIRLDNGDVQFVYKETTKEGTANVGKAGTVRLPSEIRLSLRRFVGEEPSEVRAALRHRKSGNGLSFGVVLLNAEEVTEQAVEAVAEKLRGAIPRTYAGTGA